MQQKGIGRTGARFGGLHSTCPQAGSGAAERLGLLRRSAAAVGEEPARFQEAAAGLVRGPSPSSDHQDYAESQGLKGQIQLHAFRLRLPLLSIPLILQGLRLGICIGIGCLDHTTAALSLQGTSQDPISSSRNQGRGPKSR